MAVEKSVMGTVPEEKTTGEAMPKLLPLENGDRLTRHEFERRYQAMSHIKRAELIDICSFRYHSSTTRLSSLDIL